MNFTKIINDKFTLAEQGAYGIKFPAVTQVKVISESPHTVVLFGNLITNGLHDNIYLWQAMDLLKSHGFKLTQRVHDGAGSEGNPGRVYLVMEHP